MVRFCYHPESDDFFIWPGNYIHPEVDEFKYYEWMYRRIQIKHDTRDPGAYVACGIAAYLNKFSVPLGFTTMDNDTFWYYSHVWGEHKSICLSRYSEYWQAQIIDIIFPLIQPYEDLL